MDHETSLIVSPVPDNAAAIRQLIGVEKPSSGQDLPPVEFGRQRR